MQVILKKDKRSAKFNVTFKKGIAMKYDPSLKAVEHPMMPNVWLVVSEKDFEEAKNYVIMGDNNFWYSTTGQVTKAGLDAAIKEVKDGIKKGDYDHSEDPGELHVFETKWSKTIDL